MQTNTRRLPFRNLFWAFVLTNIAFVFIFLFAYSISYLNYQGIVNDYDTLRESILILEGVASTSSCDYSLVTYSSERLDEVSSRLQLLETRFGKEDVRIIKQKNLYSDLQLAHYRVISRFNEACSSDFVPFLFFYSNEKAFQDASDTTGYILSTLKREYPSKAMVYSFDVNVPNEALEELKEQYHIGSEPVVVLPDERVIFVDSISQLEPYLL